MGSRAAAVEAARRAEAPLGPVHGGDPGRGQEGAGVAGHLRHDRDAATRRLHGPTPATDNTASLSPPAGRDAMDSGGADVSSSSSSSWRRPVAGTTTAGR